MSTSILIEEMSKSEIIDFSVSFTNRKPAGESLIGGTVTHYPPLGVVTPLAITPSVNGDAVEFDCGPLADLGQHKLVVTGEFSNGAIAEVRLLIPVEW